MFRYLISVPLICAVLASGAAAQYYSSPGRMSPDEAQVIADYWIRSYLRRSARPDEVQALASQLAGYRAPAEVLAGLLASRDYYHYASGTPHGYIHQLTEDVGHYRPSPYEVENRLRHSGHLSRQMIAYDFLRDYPKNWWPGPAATPPRELRYFYGYGGGYDW
jgi:hypothetical protein